MNNERAPSVLCIDDDATTLTLLQYLLQQGKYDVLSAGDGRQGIELAKAQQPEVILLDVEMPGLNGYEVCQQLQMDPITSYIPVVFLTAIAGEEDRKRAFTSGAADFLAKPFHLDSLLQKIQTQLERNKRWQQLKMTLRDSAPPFSRYHDFKKTVARTLGFSAGKNAQWRQIAAVQLYDKAVDFDITHTELAQMIAEFMNVPYIEHIKSQIIRIGVMPTAFSKTNHILAVDEAVCGVNFILSNPFNTMVCNAMTKCRGIDHPELFGITEPANIAGLFKQTQRLRFEEPKLPPAPVGGDTGRGEEPRKRFAIPQLSPPAASAVRLDLKAPSENRTCPPEILVVDDDPTAQLLAQHFLLSSGYQVTTADDGIDALLMLGQRRFDLIISDVNMPNLDGFKLLEFVNQKALNTPVIIITGSTGPEEEIRGFELGAADYIRKPLSKEALLFRVRKALGEQHSHRGAA